MPNPNPATLEEARELLLQQSEQLTQLQQQVETLTGESGEKDATIEQLRTLNQQLFLRASQGTAPATDPESDPEPAESLEDFARTKLKGVII